MLPEEEADELCVYHIAVMEVMEAVWEGLSLEPFQGIY